MNNATLVFPDSPTRSKLHVKWAQSPQARSQGLMHVTDLPWNHGMLFSFKQEDVRQFWMKNTPLPLDMIFIDRSSLIVGIYPDAPPNNTFHYGVEKPSMHVVEVNAGWSQKQGVSVGQRVAMARMYRGK